uniref:N-acetyltransferase domain-containing protein n=1 Tax=Globodera rostochiensis TaxID=31243 RepID=A0A914H5U6_GLORO
MNCSAAEVCQFASHGRKFIIETLSADSDRADVYAFMQNIFRTNEPITCAIQSSALDTSQIFANICADCFQYDLSLVAKDTDGGTLIAICLNTLCEFDEQKEYTEEPADNKREFGEEIRNGPYTSKNANRLAVYIDWVERNVGFLSPETIRRAMKLEILAVHPAYARLGLASHLLRSSVQLALSSGCSHLITCATAVASQNFLASNPSKRSFFALSSTTECQFLSESMTTGKEQN